MVPARMLLLLALLLALCSRCCLLALLFALPLSLLLLTTPEPASFALAGNPNCVRPKKRRASWLPTGM